MSCKYFIIAGVLLNSALIIINRFVRRLPDWLQIPLCVIGIVLIIAGLVLRNRTAL